MGVKENPNRKVRCVETGKFYVSIRRRSHARYRSWWFSHSEYHLELLAIHRSLSETPQVNEKRSKTQKKRFRDNPELREEYSELRKECWGRQEFVDLMKERGCLALNGTKMFSDMQKCLNRERNLLKDGKVVVRFERGRRKRSVGVVQK